MTYTERALQLLKRRGYRLTKPRRRVLETLEGATQALSPLEIKERLDAAGEPVDTVSIYRILECLEENRMVHRVLSTGKVRKCDLDDEEASDPKAHCHHNLICRGCGTIEEVHCPGLSTLEATIAEAAGFAVETHRLEFGGLCRTCR